MSDKVANKTVSQFLKRKESRSGFEPKSFRLSALRLTAGPHRLTTAKLKLYSAVDGVRVAFVDDVEDDAEEEEDEEGEEVEPARRVLPRVGHAVRQKRFSKNQS